MSLKSFINERRTLTGLVLKKGSLNTKRFFGLDTAVYRKGALNPKTKELMGLVASTVLRCDECINYHIIRSAQEGCTEAELREALDVALMVGGSIVIPHLRRAYRSIEEAKRLAKAGKLQI